MLLRFMVIHVVFFVYICSMFCGLLRHFQGSQEAVYECYPLHK